MTLTIDNRFSSFDDTCAPIPAPTAASVDREKDAEFPEDLARNLVELFKLLSDETRLRILFLLRQRSELNVRTLCQILRQSQPAVSHHLALLRSAGLIDMRRDGKHNFYRLLSKRFEESLRMIFQAVPGTDREIRFDDFVVKYSQA